MRLAVIFLAASAWAFTFSVNAWADSRYISHVTSIDQKVIKSPRNNKKQVLEGCGPVAAAMLLGYWQTQRGKKNLLSSGFKGLGKHPYSALRKLYIDLNAKKAPGANNKATYTMPNDLFKGLKKRVKGTGLKVKRLRKSKSWKKKKSALLTQLKNGNPVIILKNKEHKRGCLGQTSRGWNLIKNISNAHYFLVVGFKRKNTQKSFAIMPGWSDQPKALANSYSRHRTGSSDFGLCTFDEMKKTNPSLFWIEP